MRTVTAPNKSPEIVCLSVNQLIEKLQEARDKASMGGNTCAVISLDASGLQDLHVHSVKLDGYVIRLHTSHKWLKIVDGAVVPEGS